MPAAIPIEIYELLEDRLGKEDARKVASAIESSLEVIEKKANAVALQKKLELKDELTKELVTNAEFLGEMKAIRLEMQTLETKLESKINNLNIKLNFLIILVIIAITLMNPVAAEIIKGILKL
jgi:hypothetical protein